MSKSIPLSEKDVLWNAKIIKLWYEGIEDTDYQKMQAKFDENIRDKYPVKPNRYYTISRGHIIIDDKRVRTIPVHKISKSDQSAHE